ncbi:predicted protein [Uncinocarpus reesii 1704]|uniref:Uncharacterized protein n=1 Tax=Uncinocarpus reesii (strain UAMH 1704) TaxID=336963 RepID=C4JT31_UNCRE|nr:uncharacterized protein UREG_05620 [Uncinocarpus reesii 1704]EEP80778.1 predicted protein [Uncinocarpus reesii 1704]
MTLFDTIKSLTIFFAPILIPRAISLYRSVRQSIAQQRHVPPKPLPPKSSRALNILFLSTALFLILSLPINPHAPAPNIFALTSSRFSTPTDLIFKRLARLRPLTDTETLLRAQFVLPQARKIYLRFGPETLLSCPFCSPANPNSYLIYYIPFNILLPHLFHLLVIGIVTSAPVVGTATARWRSMFFWTAFILFLAELSFVAAYDPYATGALNMVAIPTSFYTRLYTVRTLVFTVFDGLCAALIYLSGTNRFFLGAMAPSPSADEQIDEFAEAVGTSLASAIGKLHALGLVKNAIMRDPVLKGKDDARWAEIIARSGGMVGEDGTSILDDEEVAQAVSRVTKRAQNAGHGGNEAGLSKEGLDKATKFIEGVTAGLELES